MEAKQIDQVEHATTTDGNGRDNPDKGADSMSVKEAAALFGVSERTVQRYVRKLGLRVEHVYTIRGRQLRLDQDALDRIAGYLSERLAAIPSPVAERRQGVAGVSDSENGAETRVPSNGAPGVGQGGGQGVALPALPNAALAQLRDTIRAAVVDGMTDALQRHQLAQDGGAGDRSRTALRWLEGAAYAVLIAVLSGCGWAAWSILQRAQDLVR